MWLDRVDVYQDKIILVWILLCIKNISSWSVLGLKVHLEGNEVSPECGNNWCPLHWSWWGPGKILFCKKFY